MLKKVGTKVVICPEWRLIFLPVKHNWWEKASLPLIEQGVESLGKICGFIMDNGAEYIDVNNVLKIFNIISPIYLVRPGCGNGGLDWRIVSSVCERHLDDRFVVVERRKHGNQD